MNPSAFACAHCGALNGADFERCIRCAKPLKRGAPEAEASGSGAGPSPRAAGSRSDAATEGHHYWATKAIIWTTLVIFAGQIFLAFQKGASLAFAQGGDRLVLLRFGAMEISLDAVLRAPFSMLSSVFVHFGIIHLGMNLMGLVNLARIAEPAVGTARFAIVYVVTGLAGSAATLAWSVVSPSGAITAGASGAIFGIMGLLLGWLLRRRDPAWKQFAVQAVFYSVVFGFLLNASNAMSINNSAHLGGLFCGVLFGLLYGKNPVGGADPRRGSDSLVSFGAAACLVACVVSLAMAQLSPRWHPSNEAEAPPIGGARPRSGSTD